MNYIKRNQRIILISIFTSVFIFLFWMAFDKEFASPCEPNNKIIQIFCFISPLFFTILISLTIYFGYVRKNENSFIEYLKVFILTLFAFIICFSFAIYIARFVEEILENKLIETKNYNNYFEIKCGCDDYKLNTFIFSILISILNFISNILLYHFVKQVLKIKRN